MYAQSGDEYGDKAKTVASDYINEYGNDLSSEERKALNTIIYGTEAGLDTYDSIADIPMETLVNSFDFLNGYMDGLNHIENQITYTLDNNN